MTDEELTGIAAQAWNMARDAMKQEEFSFLLGLVGPDGVLSRIPETEGVISAAFGLEWMNRPTDKDTVFRLMRQACAAHPPAAIVLVAGARYYQSTPKLATLPEAEASRILKPDSREALRQSVADGYLEYRDGLLAMAQTPERLCTYFRDSIDQPPLIEIANQSSVSGRTRLYG